MTIEAIAGWNECHESLRSLIQSPEPAFVGRIGGSDTDAIAAMLQAGTSSIVHGRSEALNHLSKLRRFNGFYDHANSNANYFRYLDCLLTCYRRSKHLTFVDAKLLTMYFQHCINPRFQLSEVPWRDGFKKLVESIAPDDQKCFAYPYTFYETITGPKNLFRVFEESLWGEKVLVITPFAESIRANWPKRRSFLRNFDYPEFELLTVNTPVTYDGLPREFYPHNNWFGTLGGLISEISNIDFDIALIACGSYAMPIGDYISSVLQRKAIYVGGVLQLFFGIMGRRYENPFFLPALDASAFIYPLEKARFFKHITSTADEPKEAFGAYF